MQQLLQEAEKLVHHNEQNVTQRRVIETLEQAGQVATLAEAFLEQLESKQAGHIAERNRLSKELADKS